MWFSDDSILSLGGNLFFRLSLSQQDEPQLDFTLTIVTAWDPTAGFLGLYEEESKKEIVDLSKMGRQLCFPSVCIGIRLGTGFLVTRKVAEAMKSHCSIRFAPTHVLSQSFWNFVCWIRFQQKVRVTQSRGTWLGPALQWIDRLLSKYL